MLSYKYFFKKKKKKIKFYIIHNLFKDEFLK